MKKSYQSAGRIVTLLAGLAIGIGLAVIFIVNRQAPTHDGSVPAAPALAAIEVRTLPFQLEARGYGVARPAETWNAVANVPGRVVERHPNLKSGVLLKKGTLLLALDSGRFTLAIAEAEAELAGLAAETRQLETEDKNTRSLLALEKEQLNLAERELSRIESLAERGTISPSRRDEQFRATLAQRQTVSSLENQLSLTPSRLQRLKARKEQAATRLDQAHRDLEDTRFMAPYDLRLTEVDVEMHQHVMAGQRVFQAENIDAAEVEVHMPISMIRRVMEGAVVSKAGYDVLDIVERMDFSAIDATVHLAGVEGVRWPARVSRVAGGLDPATRTVRVVVVVDDPYRLARPPERPPLQLNMYVRVHLTVQSPEPLLAVPASAVHQGKVYVVDETDRIEIRPVQTAFEQRDMAVITDGLKPGEIIVVDDPSPALNGMPVLPRRDRQIEQRLRKSAAGE